MCVVIYLNANADKGFGFLLEKLRNKTFFLEYVRKHTHTLHMSVSSTLERVTHLSAGVAVTANPHSHHVHLFIPAKACETR